MDLPNWHTAWEKKTNDVPVLIVLDLGEEQTVRLLRWGEINLETKFLIDVV